MSINKKNTPLVLTILDGWGINKPYSGNAITLARKPNFDFFWQKHAHTELKAHGKYVGLPEKQDGNSEAGHLNLGAGRIVRQEAIVINEAIKDNTFFKNPALKRSVEHVKKRPGRQIHLMGLLTGFQSAHADPAHLIALLKFYRQHKFKNIFIHLFTDGRDSDRYGALDFLKRLEKELLPYEKIATISGRYYAMDRKNNWDRTVKIFQAMTTGRANYYARSAEDALNRAYDRGETDEFILPTVIVKHGLCDKSGLCLRGEPETVVKSEDSIIFFNLRSDRTRQLTRLFTDNKFIPQINGFRKIKKIKELVFVTMTDYGPDLENVLAAFPAQEIKNSLPEVLSAYHQLYIAETEKYAHITYFFNGGHLQPVNGEQQKLIPSPNVATYDLTPEMSAKEITRHVVNSLNQKKHDFIAINFANPDMVAHTGNLAAGIRAVECIDYCLGKIYQSIKKQKGILIITADHGNVEEMINKKNNTIDTKHSSYPVPFIIIDERQIKIKKYRFRKNGVLANVAPTILDLMGVKKPTSMTEKSLII
ncbi:MAG TPA: 2,3-bisphosphoglycerate-independent phosphoglycerate mutase [bacterium]|nr:2,3-bisphosphoglycerate-independent phosphoglycerate mutase [bacterium]HPL95238.1 2,3-bisphosphoglycerate-independent phosphoglycerate mutase [bacterium]